MVPSAIEKKPIAGSLTIPTGSRNSVGDWYYIRCDCGRERPVLKTTYPRKLREADLPEDTPIESLKSKGCPECKKPPGLYVPQA